MSAFAGLLIALFFLVILLCMIYMGLVYPVFALVHCASGSKAFKSKAPWCAALVLGTPVASFFYSFFSDKEGLFRSATRLYHAVLAFYIIGGALVLSLLLIYYPKTNSVPFERLRSDFRSADLSELNRGQIDTFRSNLDFLGDMLDRFGPKDLLRLNRIIGVQDGVRRSLEDGKLDVMEYMELQSQFRSFKNYGEFQQERFKRRSAARLMRTVEEKFREQNRGYVVQESPFIKDYE